MGGSSSEGGGNFPADDVIRKEYMVDEASEAAETKGSNFLDKLHETVEHDSGATAREYQEWLDAADYYQGDGYVSINSILRANPDAMDEFDDEDEEDEDGPSEMRMAAALQLLLDEAPALDKPVITYRGLTGELNFKEGDEVVLNGFQSTSFDPAVAYNFATGDDPSNMDVSDKSMILEIRANQGLSFGGHSKSGETEFLIPHGLPYKVHKIGERTVTTGAGPRRVKLIQLEMKTAVGK